MSLVKAVADRIEVDETLNELLDDRIERATTSTDTDERKLLWDGAQRLALILKPFPVQGPDTWRGLPSRRVEARAWAGVITNPGAFGQAIAPEGGRRRSVYLDSNGADSHGVHAADAE